LNYKIGTHIIGHTPTKTNCSLAIVFCEVGWFVGAEISNSVSIDEVSQILLKRKMTPECCLLNKKC
jgi:hypothetical protein